jgi:hypothetical protein
LEEIKLNITFYIIILDHLERRKRLEKVMKRIFAFNIVSLILLLLSSTGISQSADTSIFVAQDPVLISSSGQSADVLMLKVLSEKAGLKYVFDKTASPDLVDSVKSVILVTGGSTKGLGAANIDKEAEYKRVEAIITRARKNKLPVIAFHVGGKSRRGTLSDYFNKLAAENADCLVVVAGGDEDGFFSNIAKEKNIPIEFPEKIASIQGILQKIYDKNRGQSK